MGRETGRLLPLSPICSSGSRGGGDEVENMRRGGSVGGGSGRGVREKEIVMFLVRDR